MQVLEPSKRTFRDIILAETHYRPNASSANWPNRACKGSQTIKSI